MCEDCGLKGASYGLAADKALVRAKRWCAQCGKQHPGAVDVMSRKCETCKLKQANYGMPAIGGKVVKTALVIFLWGNTNEI